MDAGRASRPARRLWLGLGLAVVAGLIWWRSGPADVAPPQVPPENRAGLTAGERWQVMMIGDVRVGYGRTQITPVEIDGAKRLRVEVESTLLLKRFGQPLETHSLVTSDETPDGELLSFKYTLENPPADPVVQAGRIEGDELHLQTTTAGETHDQTAVWNRAWRTQTFYEADLHARPLVAGESRTYHVFLPELNAPVEERLTARQVEPVRLLDGTERNLLKVDVVRVLNLGAGLQELPLTVYLDDTGEALVMTMALGNLKLNSYAATRDVALQSITAGELDLAVDTLVPVKKIAHAHETTRVVYDVTLDGLDPLKYLATGPTQAVERRGPHAAKVTVTSPAAPASGVNQESPGKEFLASTRFLQADDPRVTAHATQVAADETDPWKVAQALEAYVRKTITQKNFSTALASAAETAESLSGDCTEHACLLAALCRARGVPARIAVGLVYVEGRQAFAGHMWTEVYAGDAWRPLDGTIGQGRVGAAHIKLADSSFADSGPAPVGVFLPLMQILGRMQITVREVEPAM